MWGLKYQRLAVCDNASFDHNLIMYIGKAGCKVIVNYASNEAAALEVCEEIKALGGEIGAIGIPIKANIGSVEEIQQMFAKVNEEVISPSHPCSAFFE